MHAPSPLAIRMRLSAVRCEPERAYFPPAAFGRPAPPCPPHAHPTPHSPQPPQPQPLAAMVASAWMLAATDMGGMTFVWRLRDAACLARLGGCAPRRALCFASAVAAAGAGHAEVASAEAVLEIVSADGDTFRACSLRSDAPGGSGGGGGRGGGGDPSSVAPPSGPVAAAQVRRRAGGGQGTPPAPLGGRSPPPAARLPPSGLDSQSLRGTRPALTHPAYAVPTPLCALTRLVVRVRCRVFRGAVAALRQEQPLAVSARAAAALCVRLSRGGALGRVGLRPRELPRLLGEIGTVTCNPRIYMYVVRWGHEEDCVRFAQASP